MTLMWATLSLKKGDGHLKEGCSRVILVLNCSVSGLDCTLGHIRALLLCLRPHLAREPIRSIGLTPLHIRWIHRSQHGRWGCPSKALTSEDWVAWNSLSFALSIDYFIKIFNVQLWDGDTNWKIMALSLLWLGNKRIGLMLSIEKLWKGVLGQMPWWQRWKTRNLNRNEEWRTLIGLIGHW